MAEAKRDQNFVPTLLAVSSTDGVTPVVLYADETTHRLLTTAVAGNLDSLTDVTITAAARGDVLYKGATDWVNLAAGIAGRVLTSGGPGADPSWTAAGSGTVTSVSVVDANGLTGSVATATSTPAITLSRKYRTIAGITTLANTDSVVKCTGTTYTVTLMSAATAGVQQVVIKNSASGNITVDGSGTETIDGSLTAVLTPNTSLTLFSDGTNWFII